MLSEMEEPPLDLVGLLLSRARSARAPGEYAVVFTYLRDERTEKPLVEMLSAKDPATLSLVVFAVGERRIGAASDRLLEIAGQADGDWRVRVAAVAALQKINDRSTVPGIISVAGRETNREVLRRIFTALRAMTGKGGVPNSASAWRKWWNEEGSKG
jgi:HEAT repeat protein